MALKKSEEKSTRKLSRIGKQSIGITLPIEEVRKIGWRVGQKLTIKRIHGGFEIKDWRK